MRTKQTARKSTMTTQMKGGMKSRTGPAALGTTAPGGMLPTSRGGPSQISEETNAARRSLRRQEAPFASVMQEDILGPILLLVGTGRALIHTLTCSGFLVAMERLATKLGLGLASTTNLSSVTNLTALQWLIAGGFAECQLPDCVQAIMPRRANARGARVNELTRIAADHGDLELLLWLQGRGCRSDRTTFEAASGKGHLPVLEWLTNQGVCFDDRACIDAAKWGYLEVLQWLCGRSYRWKPSACEAAAEGGHLEVLKWLRQKGCPRDEGACEAAAEGGHLEVLRWLRQEGCPWDEGTCEAAAEGGHLEVLQWAREEGCPWDSGVLYAAGKGRHCEVVYWAERTGCPPL